MTQAYPQFTPVQILEAGRRAMAEGRGEYASQFFQHLIDHYSTYPEAADARDAMAELRGRRETSAPASQYAPEVNGQGADHYGARQQKAMYPNGAAGRPAGIQLGVMPSGANGLPGGYAARQSHRPSNEPGFGPATDDAATDMPRHIARQSPNYRSPPPARPTAASTPHRFAPAPEKNYIIGRVISGLLLLIGILSVFAAIPILFAAFTAPQIFAQLGLSQPAQPLIFASALFAAALVLLLASQMATALFNAADAASDLARLERFRAGEYDDDEDD